MSNLKWNKIGFVKNPFGIIPDIDQDTIIWAGFKKNKNRFDTIIKNCLTSQESNLVLNLSRWGGGKTHTSVFYSKEKNLPQIGQTYTAPLNIFVITPKEGNYGAYEFYTKVIESFRVGRICSVVKSLIADVGSDESLALLKNWSNSEDIGRVIWLLGDENADISFGAEQLLFGSGTATTRNKLRIRRSIESISDKFQVLSAIIRIFSKYDENRLLLKPRRIFLWIDELESLIYYSSKQFRPFTQAIRALMDSTPSYLSVFMNFSFSEPSDIQNIKFVIGSALLDRITEKVIFEEASKEESMEYISDLFRYFRIKGFDKDKYYPFTQDSLNKLFDVAPKLAGLPLMPRTINKWCLFSLKAANNENYFEEDEIKLVEPEFIDKLDYRGAID